MANEWLIYCLSALFLACGGFYLYRIICHKRVRRHYGYVDLENEVGHGLCMFAMAAMLAPALLPIPFWLWAIVLGAGSGWFLLRTFTWGLRLPYNWYAWDLIHVAMLGLMALMFTGLTLPVVAVSAAVAFWLFFTGYAAYWAYMVRREGRPTGFLEFGSDSAHILMGVAMAVMTLWPSLLMPNHTGHTNPAPAVVAAPHNGVIVATDSTYQQAIFNSSEPVVILVFGGCEKCAAEIPVFEQLALKYSGRVRFVRINKDSSPEACKQLGATDCPTLIFRNGSTSSKLTGSIDQERMRQFIEEELKK